MNFVISKINGRDVASMSADQAANLFYKSSQPILVQLVPPISSSSSTSTCGATKLVNTSSWQFPTANSSLLGGGSVTGSGSQVSRISEEDEYEPDDGERDEGTSQAAIASFDLSDAEEDEKQHREEQEEEDEQTGEESTEMERHTDSCRERRGCAEEEPDSYYFPCLKSNYRRIFNTELKKSNPDQMFGLTLCYQQQHSPTHLETHVFVSEIEPGSIAAADGRGGEAAAGGGGGGGCSLAIGDQILAINHQPVLSRNHVISQFKLNGGQCVHLRVARPIAESQISAELTNYQQSQSVLAKQPADEEYTIYDEVDNETADEERDVVRRPYLSSIRIAASSLPLPPPPPPPPPSTSVTTSSMTSPGGVPTGTGSQDKDSGMGRLSEENDEDDTEDRFSASQSLVHSNFHHPPIPSQPQQPQHHPQHHHHLYHHHHHFAQQESNFIPNPTCPSSDYPHLQTSTQQNSNLIGAFQPHFHHAHNPHNPLNPHLQQNHQQHPVHPHLHRHHSNPHCDALLLPSSSSSVLSIPLPPPPSLPPPSAPPPTAHTQSHLTPRLPTLHLTDAQKKMMSSGALVTNPLYEEQLKLDMSLSSSAAAVVSVESGAAASSLKPPPDLPNATHQMRSASGNSTSVLQQQQAQQTPPVDGEISRLNQMMDQLVIEYRQLDCLKKLKQLQSYNAELLKAEPHLAPSCKETNKNNNNNNKNNNSGKETALKPVAASFSTIPNPAPIATSCVATNKNSCLLSCDQLDPRLIDLNCWAPLRIPLCGSGGGGLGGEGEMNPNSPPSSHPSSHPAVSSSSTCSSSCSAAPSAIRITKSRVPQQHCPTNTPLCVATSKPYLQSQQQQQQPIIETEGDASGGDSSSHHQQDPSHFYNLYDVDNSSQTHSQQSRDQQHHQQQHQQGLDSPDIIKQTTIIGKTVSTTSRKTSNEMKWVAKRRPDGTKYISRRPASTDKERMTQEKSSSRSGAGAGAAATACASGSGTAGKHHHHHHHRNQTSAKRKSSQPPPQTKDSRNILDFTV